MGSDPFIFNFLCCNARKILPQKATRYNSFFCCYTEHMSLLENPKATFDYEILERLEAGLELFGFEVKSLRGKHGSLKSAHVVTNGTEAFLLNATIPPYQMKNTPAGYDPTRTRRLLLSKKEAAKLTGSIKEKGLTIIPLSLYNKGRFIKVSLAVARGKKKYDKRDTIKKRESDREIHRAIKDKL